MIRIAKPTDQKKLEELKKKVGDKVYLEYAIQQIAQTLTKEILQVEEEQ